jgi:FAD:protein FMN transferase
VRGAEGVRWPAFGSTAELLVADPAALGLARRAVEAEIAAIDSACSRFRDDSELARLNARTGRPVRVGPLLAEAIAAALRIAAATSGDVDPTVGRALRVAGYDRDFAELEDTGVPGWAASAEPAPGWRQVRLDRETRMVQTPPGVELDLGSSAKALAADRAAASAAGAAGCPVLVNLGGDLALGGGAPAAGWAVRVTEDHAAGLSAPGQTVLLRASALATSSTTVRRWRRGGQPVHHILDPATGLPAPEAWRTVSVAAARCVDANAASTAAIVRGLRAPAWLEDLGLPARLVAADGEAVIVGAWPAPERAAA